MFHVYDFKLTGVSLYDFGIYYMSLSITSCCRFCLDM